jgi:hypothetical protein
VCLLTEALQADAAIAGGSLAAKGRVLNMARTLNPLADVFA